MRLPRDVTPAARARRALLFDLLAAVALTTVVVIVSAGIGVVGFVGLLAALVLIPWYGIEALVRLVGRARAARGRRWPVPARRAGEDEGAGGR